MKLTLTVIKDTFVFCRLSSKANIPEWVDKKHIYSITHTEDELSIICVQNDNLPIEGLKIDKNWRAIKVEGPLDFALVGVMANLSGILAEGQVSLSVISTYDTDYLFVKTDKLEKAIHLLLEAGHAVNR